MEGNGWNLFFGMMPLSGPASIVSPGLSKRRPCAGLQRWSVSVVVFVWCPDGGESIIGSRVRPEPVSYWLSHDLFLTFVHILID